MKIQVLLSFILLASLNAFGQKSTSDYLVTAAGDTLRGSIKQVGKHSTKVRLFRAGMATAEFTAAEARSYGSSRGVIAVSKQVGKNGTPQFVEPLVTGQVSAYRGENSEQENRFYLQASDSAYAVEVAPATAQLTYARQLTDCSAFNIGSNEFQATYPYNSKGVSKLIMAYNQCRYPQENSQLAKKDSGIRTSFGMKVGLNETDFFFQEGTAAMHTEASGFQGGLTLEVVTRTHFSAQVEGVYVALRSKYAPAERLPSGVPPTSYTQQLRFSQFQVPMLLRYTVGYGKLRPYLNAGMSLCYNFGNKSVYNVPKSSTTIEELPVDFARFSLGEVVGAGLSVHLPSLPVTKLEVRVDRGHYQRLNDFGFNMHTSVRLDFGISF